jgi:hypothetical protein
MRQPKIGAFVRSLKIVFFRLYFARKSPTIIRKPQAARTNHYA